jgi:hypothetical protein
VARASPSRVRVRAWEAGAPSRRQRLAWCARPLREIGLKGVEMTEGSWETLKAYELVGIDLCHGAYGADS